MVRVRSFLVALLSVSVVLPSCGGGSSKQAPGVTHAADAGADALSPSDGGSDAPLSDGFTFDVADVSLTDSQVDASGDAPADAVDGAVDVAVYDAGPCTLDPVAAEADPRTVLVTHPLGGSSSECGRFVRVLRLDAAGTLTDTAQLVDVGDCPQRVRFSPDGRLALVINNNGYNPQAGTQSVVVLRNDGSGKVTFGGEIGQFSGTNPVDVAFSLGGKKAYVADYDVAGKGGVHELNITPGCSAAYVKKISFTTPRAVQVLPGDLFALVMGGKEPIDTAIVDLKSGVVVKQFDLFPDLVEPQTLALSPDGKTLVVPNSSPYSSIADSVSTVAIDTSGAFPVPSLKYTLPKITEPTAVAFSPDGTKVVVSNFSGNEVTWLNTEPDGTLFAGGTVPSISFPGYLTMLRRGPNAGLVLVAAVTTVRQLRFKGEGMIDEATLALGSGNDAIAGDISIEP